MINMSQQQSSLEGVVHHQHHHQQQQQQQGVRERERAAAESTFIQTWQGVTAAMPSYALIGHSTNMSATSQRERAREGERGHSAVLCCALWLWQRLRLRCHDSCASVHNSFAARANKKGSVGVTQRHLDSLHLQKSLAYLANTLSSRVSVCVCVSVCELPVQLQLLL